MHRWICDGKYRISFERKGDYLAMYIRRFLRQSLKIGLSKDEILELLFLVVHFIDWQWNLIQGQQRGHKTLLWNRCINEVARHLLNQV